MSTATYASPMPGVTANPQVSPYGILGPQLLDQLWGNPSFGAQSGLQPQLQQHLQHLQHAQQIQHAIAQQVQQQIQQQQIQQAIAQQIQQQQIQQALAQNAWTRHQPYGFGGLFGNPYQQSMFN